MENSSNGVGLNGGRVDGKPRGGVDGYDGWDGVAGGLGVSKFLFKKDPI